MRFLVTNLVVTIALVAIPPAQAAGETPEDLQALIDATPTGGTLVLEAGVYAGGVAISNPITLRGEPGAIIDAGGEGSAIQVDAPDVTIDGLTIRNTGASLDRENSGISVNAPRVTITNNVFVNVLFGIFLRGSHDSVVAGNVVGAMDVDLARRGDGIRLWESHGSEVSGNQVLDGRDVVLWFSDDLLVTNNEVEGGRYGLHFMYSDNAVVTENRLTGNSVGAFLMYSRELTLADNVLADNQGPSGYGLGLKDMDGVTAEGNRFVGNRVGLYLDNSPWSRDVYQHFTQNLFAYNQIGVAFLPSVERNVFTRNAFVDNGEQVSIQGGGTLSGNEWSLDGIGNYWSDFAGYDADGDGIGDIQYRFEELYSTLTDDHPELRFFAETPAARAVTLAGEMFPVLRPRTTVEDPAPLVAAPAFASVDTGRTDALKIALAAMVMLAFSVGVITRGSKAHKRQRAA